MHKIEMSRDVLDRVKRLRDGLHMFGTIVPSRTAHIIVDLQNGFMEPGATVEMPVSREIVPNVNRICQAVRAAGGDTVFVADGFSCREQIAQNSSRRGVHLAEVLVEN